MKQITLLLLTLTALQFNSKAQSFLLANASSKNLPLVHDSHSKKWLGQLMNTSLTDRKIVPGYIDYIRKSKNFRATGLVLLGTGVASSAIGLAIATNSSSSFNDDQTAAILFGVGAATGIASIPFMIMAHVYKHKATLSLDNKKTGSGIPFNAGSVTGLTLSMNIGK